MELQGTVRSGLGDGAAYIGMDAYQERFEEALGFTPFPGTLNLEVAEEETAVLKQAATCMEIDGFEKDGETFSAVDVYPVTVEDVDAALLELAVTDHPPTVVELIAPANLRQELRLEDGDTVTCRPR